MVVAPVVEAEHHQHRVSGAQRRVMVRRDSASHADANRANIVA